VSVVAAEPSTLITQCAWCWAVRVDGVYLRCPAIGHIRMASHGICPECRAKVDAGEDTPNMPPARG
jgi:hypothetical protein